MNNEISKTFSSVNASLAAIIPVTPIVSIAGSTLSEITTTTTSTTTTPTPTPIATEPHHRVAVDIVAFEVEQMSDAADEIIGVATTAAPSNSKSALTATASTSISTSTSSPTLTASSASAGASIEQPEVETESDVSAGAKTDDNSAIISKKEKLDGKPDKRVHDTNNAANVKQVVDNNNAYPPRNTTDREAKNETPPTSSSTAATAVAAATAPITSTTTTAKSESKQNNNVDDLDENTLKLLLEEAYTYRSPTDKKNKSKMFLHLLEEVNEKENEKEDQPFHNRSLAQLQRNFSASSTSNNNYHYQTHQQATQPKQSNHHKQGGSLQDIADAAHNDLAPSRQNHNSRQKKYSSVSSRQREGGSLPSNVNVANCGSWGIGGGIGGVVGVIATASNGPAAVPEAIPMESIESEVAMATMSETQDGAPPAMPSASNSGGNSVISTASNNATNTNTTITTTSITATGDDEVGAAGTNGNAVSNSTNSAHSAATGCVTFSNGNAANDDTSGIGNGNGNANANANGSGTGAGDCVIDMSDTIEDIQQQKQAVNCLAPNSDAPNATYYERIENVEKRAARSNMVSSYHGRTDHAPTTNAEYIDEKVRFAQIEGNLHAFVSNTTKSTNSKVDTKYIPLDENYKSCKSVMGEKDPIKQPAAMFSTTKTITRQFDENGNSLNEMYPTTAIMSGLNVPSTSMMSQSQAKTNKTKKKSHQERNTKTVDVESVEGYCGKLPVEQLVKYIESNADKPNELKSTKWSERESNSKRKERKKDKDKERQQQQKMKKSNSLEELRTCTKMDVGELKETSATTESNIMMRHKGAGTNQKGGKNNSSSTVDINKNCDGNVQVNDKELPGNVNSAASGKGARKNERRSWGTEELQYLGEPNTVPASTSATSATTASTSAAAAASTTTTSTPPATEEKSREKKISKSKDKDSDKDADKDRDKDKEKDKEKEKEKETNGKAEKSVEKMSSTELAGGKGDKSEKRKKLTEAPALAGSSIPPAGVTVVDILAMDSLVPETAEFHVVTKKKKAKKQRLQAGDESNFGLSAAAAGSIGNNNMNSSNSNSNQMSNTSGGCGGMAGGSTQPNGPGSGGAFNRAHNFVTSAQQKHSGSFQQRYKNYNNNNANNNNNSNSNNSGNFTPYGNAERFDYIGAGYHSNQHSNNNNSSSGSGGSNSFYHNYHYNNSVSNYGSNGIYNNYNNSNQHHMHPHQQHYQQYNQHQQHQHQHRRPGGANGGDKSRRKSTSSMPPSEKSDSSDGDSVHSLPIESSTANKQRHRNNNSTAAQPDAGKERKTGTHTATGPAPISYADITKTFKETQSNTVTINNNNNSSNVNTATAAASAMNGIVSADDEAAHENVAEPTTSATAHRGDELSVPSAVPAKQKVKKSWSKPDFPELVAVVPPPAPTKSISYSQSVASSSVVATSHVDATLIPELMSSDAKAITTNAPSSANAEMVATVASALQHGLDAVESAKYESGILSSSSNSKVEGVASKPQQQQLHKSKSVDQENYNYNSSNIDQQYPALEKTVKRHSSASVAASYAPTTTPMPAVPPANQFNFAAAAKQQLNAEATSGGNANNRPTTSSSAQAQAPPTPAESVASVCAAPKKPASSAPVVTIATGTISAAGAGGDTAVASRKSKKEKQSTVVGGGDEPVHAGDAHTTSDHRLTTATQTSAIAASAKAQPSASSTTTTIAATPTSEANSKRNKTHTATVSEAGNAKVSPNRPAVIILNDDRANNANNDFTFGDFNEDELKFLDDGELSESSDTAPEHPPPPTQQLQQQQQHMSYNDEPPPPTAYIMTELAYCTSAAPPQALIMPPPDMIVSDVVMHKSKLSPTSGTVTFFNDSGASTDAAVNNLPHYADEMIMVSGVDASSPNISFVNANHSGNQSHDSGIFTKTVNRAISPSLQSQQTLPPTQAGQAQPPLMVAMYDGTAESYQTPQQQQLETCNDIESAIFAAARAAAAEQHHHPHHQHHPQHQPNIQYQYTYEYQQPPYQPLLEHQLAPQPHQHHAHQQAHQHHQHHHQSQHQQQTHHHHQQHEQQQQQQQQQQQYHQQQQHDMLNSSNSSSFSSSSSVSVDKYPQPVSPTAVSTTASYYSHTHRDLHTSNIECPSRSRSCSQSHSRSRSRSRSRSNSSQRELVVSFQSKDYDIHFIQPNPPAFSAMQQNDIIVDFIGSAWDAIASSNGTEYYNGQ